MSLTSAVGLFAIFAVDLVDVYFISLLGEPELAAAVGFAGTALFFGAAYATAQMAKFDTDAVAAAAVIDRITPVAFAGLYLKFRTRYVSQ